MSHFFDPFPIQILPSKAIPTDFPLFSNSLWPFSPDILYSRTRTKSWIGWDYAESRGFETIEVDSSVDLGVKIPIREQRLLCPIRSQHFFREFETNYNYTGSLC